MKKDEKKVLLDKIYEKITGLNFDDLERTYKELISILHEIPYFNWVGIYLVEGRELVLSYYLGLPTPHKRIRFGRGICGTSAESAESVVVKDVSLEKNYLTCSEDVKSEIVVPIKSGSDVLGVIDVDSNKISAFDELDKKMVEKVSKLLSR